MKPVKSTKSERYILSRMYSPLVRIISMKNFEIGIFDFLCKLLTPAGS